MSKIVGGLFALVLAVSLVLVPAPVSAGFGDDCTWDTVKWEDNENSWFLYLQHWGRTPVSDMSRLAGLCSQSPLWPYTEMCPPIGACFGGCCAATSESIGACLADVICEECSATPCYGRWGVSLCFANKSWAACDISDHPRLNNEHPNHFGNSTGGAENYGGDWGLSGCQHAECVSQTWCVQDNLCP